MSVESAPAAYLQRSRRPFFVRWVCALAVLVAAIAMSASVPAAAAIPVASNLVVYDNDFFVPAKSEILPLIGNPRVRVLGFTVVTGDGWLSEETSDLLRFLEIAHRTDIPVVRGAEYPLVNTRARTLAWERQYGKLVWKGAWNDAAPGAAYHPDDPDRISPSPLGAPTAVAAPGTAAQFMIDQVHRFPHQVTIVAAGPLTNVALAIRLDPQFASLAKQLIFMGGYLDTSLQQVLGNANFATDFNIWFDPEAAHIAITAPWATITSVGTVTNDVVFTPQIAARLLEKKTPVTEAVAKYTQPFPLWDQLVTAIAADPTLITKEVVSAMDVDIDRGMGYGTTHIWGPETAPHSGERPVHVVLAVDEPRFVTEFVRAAQSVP
jgi:inosine-uridine nucleoside N-ribohydrolase